MDQTKRPRPPLPWLGAVAVVWMLTIDSLGKYSVGPLSLSGVLTLAVGIVTLVLIPATFLAPTSRLPSNGVREDDKKLRIPAPLLFFAAYAIASVLISPTADGVQNIAVYLGFIFGASVTAITIRPDSIFRTLEVMKIASVAATIVFIISHVTNSGLYSSRSFALAGLVFLSVLIPGQPRNWFWRLAPLLVVIALFLSLSRTAAVIGAMLLVFLTVRSSRKTRIFKSAALTLSAGGVVYWAITEFAPFRDRFLGGDAAINVGGLNLNTSGRANIWELVLHSAQTSPLFGKGAGSASELLAAQFTNIEHPHNEYLRLYHDFGWAGLALFLAGMTLLLLKLARQAHRHDHPIHWAALIATISVMIASLTDNVIIYPFVMIPLGVLVGASLGLSVSTTEAADKQRSLQS